MNQFFMADKECEKQWHLYYERMHEALTHLVAFDSYLFRGGQERALTHKLGFWMGYFLGKHWDVDCEYRKVGTDDKTYYALYQPGTGKKKDGTPLQEMNHKETLKNIREICTKREVPPGFSGTLGKPGARPDIIVHQRRKIEMIHNLLMLEAKFDSQYDILDEIKLMAFTIGVPLKNEKTLRYQLGLWIDLEELDSTDDSFDLVLRGIRYINGNQKTVEFDISTPNRALTKQYA